MKGVNVEVMGQNLVVASSADDDWVKAVAETVDERIKAIRASVQTANSVNLAILAALNFADELERLRKQHANSSIGLMGSPGGWRTMDADEPQARGAMTGRS